MSRLTRDGLVEWFAKAMAYRGVGDPHALDRNGKPRWELYRDEAEKFVDTDPYVITVLDTVVVSALRRA